MDYAQDVIVVRGAGDLATGVIQKLWRAGFRVAALDLPSPLTIRRTVALSTAMHESVYTVENMTARRVESAAQCAAAWSAGQIPILADPEMACLPELRPVALVDAILAKRNLGLRRGLAPVTVALGPGFSAPEDADVVVETMRGHSLGRLITDGSALPNTGTPGLIGGKSAERVVHAPCAGRVRHTRKIGDYVEKGECLMLIGDAPVPSPLSGMLRGLIAAGLEIPQSLKCADVDPRPASEVDCLSISDKARCLGGAVLEACLSVALQKGLPIGSFGAGAGRPPFLSATR